MNYHTGHPNTKFQHKLPSQYVFRAIRVSFPALKKRGRAGGVATSGCIVVNTVQGLTKYCVTFCAIHNFALGFPGDYEHAQYSVSRKHRGSIGSRNTENSGSTVGKQMHGGRLHLTNTALFDCA